MVFFRFVIFLHHEFCRPLFENGERACCGSFGSLQDDCIDPAGEQFQLLCALCNKQKRQVIDYEADLRVAVAQEPTLYV